VDEGTTVKVYLPRSATRQAAQPVERQADTAGRIAGPARRVLLVDDDSAVREVTSAMLQELGCVVVEAGSGGAALDLLDRGTDFDLMVLDFAMPGMNGAEVAREVALRRPGLAVLFVTGYADTSALGDVGEDRIVQKPYRDDDLVVKARRLLGAGLHQGADKVVPLRRGE
jgi:CheY-like chemotaxis protein